MVNTNLSTYGLLSFSFSGIVLSALVACTPSGSGEFLRSADDQVESDVADETDSFPDDDGSSEDEPVELDWVPGPIVEGQVALLSETGSEWTPLGGASVTELGVDGETIQTDESGYFAIEVENEDPWRLYVSASENLTPSIWTTSLGAVEAGGVPVLVDLFERATCKSVWRYDFRADWAEDRGAIIVLIWVDGFTNIEPEMAGMSVSLETMDAELWGLDSNDILVPVDGLYSDASQAELWLVDVPEGTHSFTWSSPQGYECFGPEQVPVMGRTNTLVQMGCRRL